ncbi:MAG: DUF4442 domain-containing protein [Thermoanaerobaculia bacterium]
MSLRRLLIRLMWLYPPYFGAGIRVKPIGEVDAFGVSMKLHWWNRNLMGTQFGGSLYSMCDPFFMILLIEKLGRDYVVWDKAAKIRFRRPGKGRVHVEFRIDPAEVERIRRAADTEPKVEPLFTAKVLDDEGQVIAEVEKLLHVRRRDRERGVKEEEPDEPVDSPDRAQAV